MTAMVVVVVVVVVDVVSEFGSRCRDRRKQKNTEEEEAPVLRPDAV